MTRTPTPDEVAREWLRANEDEIDGGATLSWFAVQSRTGQSIVSLAALLAAQRAEAYAEGWNAACDKLDGYGGYPNMSDHLRSDRRSGTRE